MSDSRGHPVSLPIVREEPQRSAPGPAGSRLFTLLVELRCNSYCVFCGEREVDAALVKSRRRLGLSVPETEYGHLRERYTLDSATEALARARAQGFTDLGFQGGEPTLFPEIVELVRRARGIGFGFIGMVTNGRRLKDPELAGALLGAGLDGITLSILGADAETHDALSAAPGSFDALLAGIDNAVAAARRLDRRLSVDANVIVSAKSVDALPEIVRLLAAHGVHAGVLHLVRFHGLASDPGVREPLRFDIRRIRPALREAMIEADRRGFTLHASDVPMCQHPGLSVADLRILARQRGFGDHTYEAPGYARSGGDEPRAPDACRGCMLARDCRFVPDEYLPEDPALALRPIGAPRVAEHVDDTLAAIVPTDPGAPARLLDLAEAIRLLGELSGRAGELAAPIARVRGALVDLVLVDLRRREGARMVEAFAGVLGLRPMGTWALRPDTWDRVLMPLSTLAANVGAVPEERAPRGPRVVIDDRYALAIDGAIGDDGTVEARAVRPIIPDAKTTPERVLRALFLALVTPRFRHARRIRVTASAIEVDAGDGFAPAWFIARPGAVRVMEPAPA